MSEESLHQRLHKQLTEDYTTMAGALTGAGSIEAYRRYQTDARFRFSIDTLVQVAIDSLLKVASTLDVSVEELAIDLYHEDDDETPKHTAPADMDALREAFDSGVLGL